VSGSTSVYRAYGVGWKLLYVGCSGDVKRRMEHHSSQSKWFSCMIHMKVRVYPTREQALAITPNDGSDLAFATRGIYIGGFGNLRVDMQDGGAAVTFVGVNAGSVLPVRASKVYATGTTAINLVGLR